MTLSIKKLYSILESKGLIPTIHYIYDKKYMLIETLSIKSNQPIMILIPEKYMFEYNPNDKDLFKKYPHYKLKKLNINQYFDVIDKYTDDNIDFDTLYPEIDIQQSISDNKNIETALVENYNVQLSLDDPKKNILEIKDLYRQLLRLRTSVKYLPYKLCITNDNYICIDEYNNNIGLYFVKNLEKKYKKMIVSINLEKLIILENDIDRDVQEIVSGIQKIIEKNFNTHKVKLNNLLEKKQFLHNQIQICEQIKNQHNHNRQKYIEHLSLITTQEEILLKQLEKHQNQHYNSNNNNIEKSFGIKKVEDELKKITENKDQNTEKLLEIQDKINNINLTLDSLLFDNLVLLKTIYTNIENFKKNIN